jgi:hypothetical protein
LLIPEVAASKALVSALKIADTYGSCILNRPCSNPFGCLDCLFFFLCNPCISAFPSKYFSHSSRMTLLKTNTIMKNSQG